MAINRVGVLYALIGVVLAKDLAEIEKDAEGGDTWDVMVRQIAYLASEKIPVDHLASPRQHVQADRPRTGVQDDWAPGNPNVRIFTLNAQDAKAAIKDIGVQGEGVGQATDMTSHFARFLAIYRGKGTIQAFPPLAGSQPWKCRPIRRSPMIPTTRARSVTLRPSLGPNSRTCTTPSSSAS